MQFYSIDEDSQHRSCIIGVIEGTHKKSILNFEELSKKGLRDLWVEELVDEEST